ncbi:hypothetical protein N7474_006607 [Penicillium riverlandense]|uniref:uncharacterized protein n=1 Tax=Penicillium riverlandense TaxID=1903569 RepID=UPI002549A6F4|nr:uncharacterized protein N7474_006607 [Penicillium riverlandense]KAJ5814830.1 hypothetical protein N7474_006607 [Penicillium riverlandense]
MATPSAKPGATPTHLTSSPHPTAPIPRSFAHKSPLTRTPSASGPAQLHQISTSSLQYATPLAVTSGVDDTVSFSSPSALLALGSYTGISPSPAVNDGLVGAAMHENDIQNLGMGFKLRVPRDNDAVQQRRIEEVVQCLRARVAGRGVSREGIERLSRLEGFESIWQEDNINIAGNFVDLEIEFHPGHNAVKDVSLRYATPEYTEGERREEATAVLKRNLVQSPLDAECGNWKIPQGFYENLQWLAKHDKLSQEINCFEALEGLEENFRRIWGEEAKTSKHGGDHEHLCTGVIGRPSMHKGARIGLGLEYWVEQAKVLDAKEQATSPDAMVIDRPECQDRDDQPRIWSIMLECEDGYPSLRISKEWVGSEVFTAGERNDSLPSNGAAGSVNWLDPPQTMRLSHGNHPDPMALDSSMLESSAPNRRFVAKLDPALDVPILAASDIYRHLGMQLPQEFKIFTYDGLLVPEWSPLSSTDPSPHSGRRRQTMSVQAFDSKGEPYNNKQHSYTFQAFESVAGRTIRDLPFSHPRQLADILPILRQYALLASLIRTTFRSSKKADEKQKSSEKRPKSSSPAMEPCIFKGTNGLITLSNDNPNESRLDSLLGKNDADDSEDGSIKREDTNGVSKDDVKVDVTLRTQLGHAPALMLLLTIPGGNDPTSSESTQPVPEPQQISICLEVGLNGRISTVDLAGLPDEETTDGGDAEMQGADETGSSAQDMRKKIARVLEISQDLGILVEWVLRWLRERAGSQG